MTTLIGEGAFYGCSGLTSVTIPESVTSIEESAFEGCSGLTSVTIPGSVTSIGEYAFEGCSGLTSVAISEGVTSIGESAFSYCNSLTSVTIPGSVTSIGEYAFGSCNGLTGIHVAEGSADYASEDGILYDYGKTSLLTYPGNREGSFMLPETVTKIIDRAFSFSGDRIKDIKIPEGITDIGDSAFSECTEIISVSIPSGVTRIPDEIYAEDIFYAGSREDLSEEYHGRAAIHYNMPASDRLVVSADAALPPDEPGTNPGGGPSVQKKAQTITAGDMTKTYGAKPFSLGASALGGAPLSYASSNGKVASVAADGTVTLNGCGVAQITVAAAETKDYKAASKTVVLTVRPKKAALSSVRSKKKKTALVKWKRDQKASGYMIECATDKKFKKNKVKATVGGNKKVSATVKKLKPGKKYYVRVCAYVKSGKKIIQGDWSSSKTVKVKK